MRKTHAAPIRLGASKALSRSAWLMTMVMGQRITFLVNVKK